MKNVYNEILRKHYKVSAPENAYNKLKEKMCHCLAPNSNFPLFLINKTPILLDVMAV